jgi:hypothetical protein
VDYQKQVSQKVENQNKLSLKNPEVHNVFWINRY